MKVIISSAVLLLLVIGSIEAQESRPSLWKRLSRYDFGVGIHVYSVATDDSIPANDHVSRGDIVSLGFMGGINLPVIPITDHISLGFNPNLGVAAGFLSVFGREAGQPMSLELPLYVTIKFGTDASWAGAKVPLGATLGVGYHYSTMLFGNSLVTLSYGLPSLMAEVNFGRRHHGLIKIRYNTTLDTHTEHFNSDDPNDKLVFSHHSFYIVFTPGY